MPTADGSSELDGAPCELLWRGIKKGEPRLLLLEHSDGMYRCLLLVGPLGLKYLDHGRGIGALGSGLGLGLGRPSKNKNPPLASNTRAASSGSVTTRLVGLLLVNIATSGYQVGAGWEDVRPNSML